MIWTARTIALLVTMALSTVGAAWGLHAIGPSGEGAGTDYGLDTDGNGAFDWLVVEADVTLPEAGTWSIYADLSATSPPLGGPCGYGYRVQPMPLVFAASSGYYPIAWTNERYFFPGGPQTVRMAFAGTDIARAGVDGPYRVHATLFLGDVILYGSERRIAEPTNLFLEWNYTTTAYDVSAFETPIRPAYFTGGHTDEAVDVDADGLADILELRADVHVNLGGPYSLSGVVLAGVGTDLIQAVAYGYRDVALTTSDTSALLRFRGDQIRAAGIDGPWNFTLTLYGPIDVRYLQATPDPVGQILPPQPLYYPEMLCGSTPSYRASAFDDTVELLRYTGRFEELTPDRDGDGTYDALVIRAEVEVLLSAGFDLSGVLRPLGSSQQAALAYGQAWFADGRQWAEFTFAGPEIHKSGVDGPYEATLSIVPIVGRIDPMTTYTTQAYRATDFDAGYADGTQP